MNYNSRVGVKYSSYIPRDYEEESGPFSLMTEIVFDPENSNLFPEKIKSYPAFDTIIHPFVESSPIKTNK